MRGYCKYCFKEIDNDHFDRYGVNYCKLFSDFGARKYSDHHSKCKFIKLYFQSLGSISISYCLLFCYWLILVKRIFPKKNFFKFNKNIAFAILLRIFKIIIWLIYFIIVVIIMPRNKAPFTFLATNIPVINIPMIANNPVPDVMSPN